MNIQNINSTENENSQIISKLFNSLNIKEYEPNTINCMNEFIKSYIKNVLKEAKKNMILAKREKITIEDVESAVNTNQNNMYKNRSKIHEMQFLADKLNSIDLPFIPESPVVLKPPINNNLLRNNFQIYSEELNKTLLDNKAVLNDNISKSSEINLIGNKRNKSIDNKNYSSNKNNKKEQKNKRKKSISQENKKSPLQQKNKIINQSVSSNSLSKDDDDLSLDNNDEIDDTNNNAGESTINKKENDDSDEEEYSEENENMNNNESNNNDNIGSSYSKNNNDED